MVLTEDMDEGDAEKDIDIYDDSMIRICMDKKYKSMNEEHGYKRDFDNPELAYVKCLNSAKATIITSFISIIVATSYLSI